ncbi:MAG: hypothetical protein LBS57_00280, partial [Treponema sp.]|nr:hypothetical protein [Treponema sp.]
METTIALLLVAGMAVLMFLPIVIFRGRKSPSGRKFLAGIFPKKDAEYKKITISNFEIKGTVLVKYLGANPA